MGYTSMARVVCVGELGLVESTNRQSLNNSYRFNLCGNCADTLYFLFFIGKIGASGRN